ncbi:MAG: response regulator [Hyphomicrobiales bacterium]|nr:response regulator [Hyphomicrobiales bacterium]
MPASVLLVEDEHLIALSLKSMIEALGCGHVEIAGSVKQALARLERWRPDCALLDLNLGHEYSHAVGDALKAMGVPYGFCTAHADNVGLFFPHDADAPRIGKPTAMAELAHALGILANRARSNNSRTRDHKLGRPGSGL